MNIADNRVFISGGGSGIGLALTEVLLERAVAAVQELGTVYSFLRPVGAWAMTWKWRARRDLWFPVTPIT
jgi:hypothetical protein